MMKILPSSLFLSALLLSACASGPAPNLVAQVLRAPEAQPAPRLVLALDADCGSMEFSCPDQYTTTVDNIVRSSMDFVGYNMVPEERVRAETTKRHETHNKSSSVTTVDAEGKTDGTQSLSGQALVHAAPRQTILVAPSSSRALASKTSQ